MRSTACTVLLACLALAGCGSGTRLITHKPNVVTVQAPAAIADLNIPVTATKNTTRVDGTTPVADAAGVALAVYPSSAPGTHPYAVVLAPTDDWQASLAASVLMAPPIRAPMLLSGTAACPRRPPPRSSFLRRRVRALSAERR